MSQPTIGEQALELHKNLKGKIEVVSKKPVKTMTELSLIYTPGVGTVSTHLAEHKDQIRDYTVKNNMVAVISDGSAVLGLGNIGPEGALPVMEGKAVLFKELAGVDAFPIVLDTQDTEEIIRTVKNIAPVFGGINLEDISAPRCFEIERRLQEMLNIPVMHDDQHGTAVVVSAALINAFKVVDKDMGEATVVVVGAGAAGSAVTKLLLALGVGNVIMLDRQGIISRDRSDMNEYKKEIADLTNRQALSGDLALAMRGADAVVGVSGPGILKAEHIKLMAEKPIVLALANPVPEIMPEEAKAAGAYVVATGRSDFPNQTNNALCFPGFFRGALDNNVRKITQEMKLSAARALASVIAEPTPEMILPTVFDPKVVAAISTAIKD
ncbi:MAG TPA: NADP-dependent malic enzyme [bacterium]|nr:MAG: NAD-dependent malic enzyme [Parcubacteria group bacterium ADurb.Bin192]HPN15309.1 NADP-dependent malic enzyme [bacterium]